MKSSNPAQLAAAVVRFLFALSLIAGALWAQSPPFSTLTVTVGTETRSANLHVPSAGGPLRGRPLVLAFHGAGQSAQGFADWVRLDLETAPRNWLLVYPEGTPNDPSGLNPGGSWNAGGCCFRAASLGVDDVAFTRALIEAVDAVEPVDRTRIYATGFSNGGMLAYRLATDAPDLVAAIAPVGASLAVSPSRLTTAIPLISFHGVGDPVIPVGGGSYLGLPNVDILSQTATHGTFETNANARLPSAPTQTVGGARLFRALGTRGAPIHRWSLFNHGHAWPGRIIPPGQIPQPTSMDIDASALMVSFFDGFVVEPRARVLSSGLSLGPTLALDHLPVLGRAFAVRVTAGDPSGVVSIWAAPRFPAAPTATPIGNLWLNLPLPLAPPTYTLPLSPAGGVAFLVGGLNDPALIGFELGIQGLVQPSLLLTDAVDLRFGY